MIAETTEVDTHAALPPDLRACSRLSDEASAALMVRVHEEVFGVDHTWLGHALLTQIAQAPETLAAFVVMAGDVPVSSRPAWSSTGARSSRASGAAAPCPRSGAAASTARSWRTARGFAAERARPLSPGRRLARERADPRAPRLSPGWRPRRRTCAARG